MKKFTKKQIAHELWLTASNYENIKESTVYRWCYPANKHKTHWKYAGHHNCSFWVESVCLKLHPLI